MCEDSENGDEHHSGGIGTMLEKIAEGDGLVTFVCETEQCQVWSRSDRESDTCRIPADL